MRGLLLAAIIGYVGSTVVGFFLNARRHHINIVDLEARVVERLTTRLNDRLSAIKAEADELLRLEIPMSWERDRVCELEAKEQEIRDLCALLQPSTEWTGARV